MVVMTERPSWSDERLDDLSERVDDGFRRNDAEHQEIRREIREGFEGINARLDAQDARFEARLDKQDARFEARMGRLEARMDTFQHTLFIFSGGLIGALIAAVITLVAKVVS